jgi:hypothetical protein
VPYYYRRAEGNSRRAGFYPLSVRKFSDYIAKLINLTKFLKGCTTIRELEEMPNHYSHSIYKSYIDMIMDEKKKQNHADEQAMDEIEDQLMP